MFDPFFTTKPAGAGAGLGLSLCQRIIFNNQGTIKVESKVGKGTTVTICLPASADAANYEAVANPNEHRKPISSEQAIEQPVWTETQQGPFHVLVVEDEDLMRSIIVQLLRREGYKVIEAKAQRTGPADLRAAKRSIWRFSILT